MLCERCGKNEANYYYHENVNGQEKTYHLCSECAEALEKSGDIKHMDFSDFNMNSMFNDFFGFGDSDPLFSLFAPAKASRGSNAGALTETKKCSLCGSTFDDIVRTGKVGCAKCYELFENELEKSIRAIHGRTTHIGHEPKLFRKKNENRQKIEALENELKTEVKNENYERAAQLRDEIKALKAQDESNSEGGAA